MLDLATSLTIAFTLQINGAERDLKVEPRVTLLDALRERLELTGAKKGCDHGQCGACTVLVDGRRVLSCLTLAVACEGKAITTIEGIATNGTLHPLQQAFIDHDALPMRVLHAGADSLRHRLHRGRRTPAAMTKSASS